MNLAERLAAARVATSAPLAAGVGNEDPTKAMNTATMAAINAAELQVAQAALATKPVRTSEDEVLFKSPRPNFGSATEEGNRFTFKYSYLLTDNAQVIRFIRKNADVWGVIEIKDPVVPKKA